MNELKQITKEQRDYGISQGIIPCVNGRYPDVTVLNRDGSSKKKSYVVREDMYKEIIGDKKPVNRQMMVDNGTYNGY